METKFKSHKKAIVKTCAIKGLVAAEIIIRGPRHYVDTM